MSVGSFSGRSNNLNLLKWIAAVLVIYSHCYSIVGSTNEPMLVLTRDQLSFGGIAVAVFFFASGFYVTGSLLKKNSGGQYVKSRIGKIYPAFITVIVLTAFVLGPIVSTYSAAEYFTAKETYTYLLYLLMIPHYTLPGVFNGNPVADVVNAPLWTLVLEMICYIGLFIAWKLRLLEKKNLRKINILVCVCILLLFVVRPAQIYRFNTYLRPLFIFIVGMEYYVFRDDIQIRGKWLLVSAVVGAAVLAAGLLDLFMILIFPYLLSAVIFSARQVGEKLGNLGNYSYAIYLTAYPVQQTLENYFPEMGAVTNCILTVILCMALSLPLYHWVEKPCGEKMMHIGGK